MIVVDTGPIVAAANRKDNYHESCVELLETHPGPLLLPSPLVGEVGYMLASRAGTSAEAAFLRDVADGVYRMIAVNDVDARRAADLVERYSNLPLGSADAFVIAVAERFGARQIATLDRKHFEIVRPAHVPAFTLLP
ncbi:PIN domain-containing protein [Georgenia sp. TF02-10]|uniref:type II toxin-antitoxin system VapC family toxin n=1 Tax=Georgenia sp. TF02-10 TaxID=2917725 RepID=UPI001FA75AF3|nr:PIN domain-containing protein [Georgenia sp. TF02-10]UNX56122.1 PIN domain-containing protein [Georgenia sp. TF02-10]